MKVSIHSFLDSKRKLLISLLIGLLLYGVQAYFVNGRVRLIFSLGESPRLYMYGLIGLSILFGVCFYSGLIFIIQLLIEKNERFLSYFKYFLIYFVIMGILLLFVWPGIFKGDEFYVLRSALNFELSPAQTGLTSCFYIICLLFFPNPGTITFMQILVICCIFSYIMRNLFLIYPSKKTWIMIVPFLLLPVLDGNLFTLRATLVGWLFLFVLFSIFFAYKKKQFSLGTGLFLSVVSGLVIAWRTEYIYLLLLLPAALWLLKLCSFKRACISLLVIALSFLLFQVPNKIAANGSNKYPISLVINPLGNLFNEEHLEGPSVYEDILILNELIDVQRLRLDASVRNISQYWNIPDVLPKEQLNRFMSAALRLIVYNFDDFLKYRWLTFAHTNGFYPNEINHPGGEMVSGILEFQYYDTNFKEIFPWMEPPFGQAARETVIEFLACRDYVQGESTTNTLLIVFYNCLPAFILLAIATLIGCFQKKKEFVILSLLIQIQVVLIFLTAPAMFFMYYYCFYLCGYAFVGLFLVELLHFHSNPPKNQHRFTNTS